MGESAADAGDDVSSGDRVRRVKPRLPIAVVIPAFDAAAHLPGAIETVRAQSVEVDEILVVDDGSRDDGAAVASALGATVLRQENAGCGPARNAGIARSRAPWIALLDADDRWERDKLERQWRAREFDPAVRLIASDHSRWEGPALRLPSALGDYANYARTPKTRLAPEVVEISGAALAVSLPVGQFLAPSTILAARGLFDDGVWFSATASTPLSHVSEDVEWYLRAIARTDVIVVERPLVRYAMGEVSLSSNAGRMHYGMLALGETIAANPHPYARGSAGAFARDRSAREALAARAFLRALDSERALAALAEFRSKRRSLELDAYLLAAHVVRLPAARDVLRALRTRWRARRRS